VDGIKANWEREKIQTGNVLLDNLAQAFFNNKEETKKTVESCKESQEWRGNAEPFYIIFGYIRQRFRWQKKQEERNQAKELENGETKQEIPYKLQGSITTEVT
jgi:hypothetical protein